MPHILFKQIFILLYTHSNIICLKFLYIKLHLFSLERNAFRGRFCKYLKISHVERNFVTMELGMHCKHNVLSIIYHFDEQKINKIKVPFFTLRLCHTYTSPEATTKARKRWTNYLHSLTIYFCRCANFNFQMRANWLINGENRIWTFCTNCFICCVCPFRFSGLEISFCYYTESFMMGEDTG